MVINKEDTLMPCITASVMLNNIGKKKKKNCLTDAQFIIQHILLLFLTSENHFTAFLSAIKL